MPLAHAIVDKISAALKEPNNTRSNRLWNGLKKDYYHLNTEKKRIFLIISKYYLYYDM